MESEKITELNLENLSLARENLKEKGETILINFIKSSVDKDSLNAYTFKRRFEEIEECVKFIDDISRRNIID